MTYTPRAQSGSFTILYENDFYLSWSHSRTVFEDAQASPSVSLEHGALVLHLVESTRARTLFEQH